MDFVRLTGIILLSAGLCLSVRVEIIGPVRSSGPPAALVIVPSAYINGIAYKPLANEIQKRSDLKLWVALMDGFSNQLPNPFELTLGVAEAMQGFRKAGFKEKKVFLAGHGLGGVMVDTFAELQHSQIEGILLFSSYPLQPLQKYPFPVLTISGDLDGLTRITKIVDTFEDLQRNAKHNPMQHYVTPVIVMEGVNHGQFASGRLPSIVALNDLNPEVSHAVAYDTIANYTNAFMVSTKNDSNQTNLDSAKALLDEAYMMTTSIIKPLSNIKALDQNEEWVSHWTITAQQLVVSLQNTTSVQFVNDEDESINKRQFIKLNPAEDLDEIKIKSYTTLYVPGYPPGSNVGFQAVTPIQLKATMMSQEAVKTLLPSSPFGTPATCRDINQEAFILAFTKSSSTAKDRYEKRGRPIKFLDDHSTTSEVNWLLSSLHMTYNRTGLFVKATRLNTSVNNSIKGIAGQNDCTLLAPFRAMEWIYIDSLKYSNSTVVS